MSRFPGIRVFRFGEFLLGLDHNRFQILAAADTTRAAATAGAIIFVDPAAVPHQIFTGRTNGHDGQIFLAIQLTEMGDGLMNALAPQVGGIQQFRAVIVNVQVNRFFCPPFKNEAVIAGPAQAGGRPTAVMAVGNGSGQGGFGDNRHTAAHVRGRSRQRTVHEAKQIVGGKGVYFRAVFKHIAHPKTACADVIKRPFFGNRLHLYFSCCQINMGHSIGISSEVHLLLLLGQLREQLAH